MAGYPLILLSFKYILRVGTHIPIKTYDQDYPVCYNANLICICTYTEYCPTWMTSTDPLEKTITQDNLL